MRLPIQPARAVTVLAVLTIVAIATSVSFLLWDLRTRELEHSRVETISLTHMFTEQTARYFEGANLVLQTVQERMQSGYGSQFALDSMPVHLLLSARIAGMPQVNALFLVDASGMVVSSSREHPAARISVADREYFKAFAGGAAGMLFVDKPVRGRNNGSWSMHIARDFRGPDGRFRGVIVATVNIPRFEELYNFMKLDYVRPLAIYLADGSLVASVPHRENMVGDHDPELDAELKALRDDAVHLVTHVGGDGARAAFAIGRVPRFPLLVSVRDDQEMALASWRETAIPIALGALLVCVFTAVIATILGRELAREARLSGALRDADDRYQQTVASVMDAIVGVDGQQHIVMFNKAAEQMFGRSAQEAMGQSLELLMPERLRGLHRLHVDLFARSHSASRPMGRGLNIIGLRADGREFPIESTVSQTLIGGQPQLTAVLRDVSERHRAESDMREVNRQLRELSASLQDVREQERTRIARELHDDLGQQLTGLKLELTWLAGRLKDARPPGADKVDEMRQMLDAAITSVRRISTELRPPILDDLGFGEAVAWQAGEFGKRSGLQITLELAAADQVTDDALATALFRIVQESLTNIARHANATRVQISLFELDDSLVLTVRDDGRGMADGHRTGRGIGLISMRERATALGGQLQVVSNPGIGTTVEVTVPRTALATTGDDL